MRQNNSIKGDVQMHSATFKYFRSHLNAGVSCEALISQVLMNIDSQDARLGLFEFVANEEALTAARALDEAPNLRSEFPLYGMPFAVKDIIDVARMPTKFGCRAPIGYMAQSDAAVVRKIKSLGAIIIGKTVTTELAFLEPSRTLNPCGTAYTPGGSSSGSAAVVSADLLPFAIGTQTGGSVIRPASYCGIFAIKPSFSLIDRFGVLSQSPALDTVGFMANSLEDLSEVIDAFCPLNLTSPKNEPLKIGMLHSGLISQADGYVLDILNTMQLQNSDMITPVEENLKLDDCVSLRNDINNFELNEKFSRLLNDHPEDISSHIHQAARAGRAVSNSDYFGALEAVVSLRDGFAGLFEKHDYLMMPSTIGEAPLGLSSTGSSIFNGPWTLMGFPVVNLPIFKGPNEMPVGIQLIGPQMCDQQLLFDARRFWTKLS
ncbi:MAG: amidase [Paracoccaceae bacterium]|nr:amidase [Paracoccaceae bacterium]